MSKRNWRSYTSGFTSLPQMPCREALVETAKLMNELNANVEDVSILQEKLQKSIEFRAELQAILQEEIRSLNKQYLKANIAKVTGKSISLVGDAILIGGVIAAPFTLGTSLLLSLIGGAVTCSGGATVTVAGITDWALSKKKVKKIQKIFEEDNKLTREIQEKWDEIFAKCIAIQENYTSISVQEIFEVLLVCCVEILPGKKETKKETKEAVIVETAAHVWDVVGGFGGGAISLVGQGRVIGGIVLTALVIRFAHEGCKASTHCSQMAGISSKIAFAANVFQFATGVTMATTIPITAFMTIADVVFLAYYSYQVHKRPDNSAGKELIRKREELEEGMNRMIQMNDFLLSL